MRLESGTPEIVERILRHNAARRMPGPQETRIDQLARAIGLVNLTTAATPVVDRTGGTLRLFAEMANAAAAAKITANDAAHFKADLAQAVAQKRFVASLPCVTLAGERA